MAELTNLPAPRPLSLAERRELEGLLAVIRGSLDRMEEEAVRIGAALLTIQSKRLYRDMGTWEEFCFDVLGAGREKGYRLIRFAKVIAHLRECCTRATLSQAAALELDKLPQELQATVYEAAGGNDATADRVKAVREILEKMSRGERLSADELAQINAGDLESRAAAHQRQARSWEEKAAALRDRFRKLVAERDEEERRRAALLLVEVLQDLVGQRPELGRLARALAG